MHFGAFVLLLDKHNASISDYPAERRLPRPGLVIRTKNSSPKSFYGFAAVLMVFREGEPLPYGAVFSFCRAVPRCRRSFF